MFAETTQLINENSTMNTLPSSGFCPIQLSWNSCSEFQYPMRRCNHENSSNWLMPDTEWMLPTSPDKDSQVLDSIGIAIFALIFVLLEETIKQRHWDSLTEYLSRGAIGFRVRLAQALEELDQVVDEAQSEGYEIPNSIAIDNAKRIVKRIYDNLLHPFQVYPMPDGEVAVDITNGVGSSVLILCCSDGSTLCFVNICGNQRRAHYSSSDALPDGFMQEALEELQQNKNS